MTVLVYANTSKGLGSPSKVYDNLTIMALPGNYPVEYNLDGSYLTMWSRGGLIFGIINIIGAPLHHCAQAVLPLGRDSQRLRCTK